MLLAAALLAAAAWSPPAGVAHTTSSPRAAIGAGGTSVVTWTEARGTFASLGDRRGRFEGAQRLAGPSGTPPVGAVAAGGAALVAFVTSRGLEVSVRRPGHRFGAPRVVTTAIGTRRDFVELAVAADPRGGYALLFTPAVKPPRVGGIDQRVAAVSLDAAGRPGPVDDLGAGRFALMADQEQAVAVDAAGTATAVFARPGFQRADGSFASGVAAVYARPPGGRFAPVAEGDPGADARVTVSGAATWARTSGGGDAGVFGPAAVLSGGVITTVATANPRRDFNPSVAPLAPGRTLVVFQRKDRPQPFSTRAPVWTAVRDGAVLGAARRFTHAAVDELLATPLSGGRALVTWRRDGHFGAALADPRGVLKSTAAPAGRSVSGFFYTSDVVVTGGRYALFTWVDRDGRLLASVRRF